MLIHLNLGEVKGFAFAKFISIEHAKQFFDKHAPCVWLDDVEVKIDYAIASNAEDIWYCHEVSSF